jgi:peroxiredoxin
MVRFYLFFVFLSLIRPCSGQTMPLSHCDSLGILPDFKFYNLKGELFTADSLKKGKPRTVVIYFKTSCEFCLSEFRMIKHNMAEFPNTQFILISRETVPELNKYDSLRQFNYFPQIRVLQDKEGTYRNYYNAYYTPSIHIYDEQFKLLHFSDGMLSKEDLLKFLKK